MRSMRDVYRKFLHSKSQNDSYVDKSVPLPFFYVRNNNFCALFMRDSEKKPICILDPSKNLASVITSQSILKLVQNIYHDEKELQEEEEEERKKQEAEHQEDLDDLIEEDI